MVIMASYSKIYAAIFPLLLGGCINQNIAPIPPAYPFKIQGYPIFVDNEPGDYDVITIRNYQGDKRYCYFRKQMENRDELFIYDWGCDLDSDRVLVFSKNKIIFATDTKHLEDEVVGMLNHILRKHKKNIIDSKDLTIF